MKSKQFRKWIIILLLLLSFPVMLTGKMDQYSEAYIDAAFERSFVTFAIARTLNGIVSVAQGTHLGIEPPMVSVNLAVGELDSDPDDVRYYLGVGFTNSSIMSKISESSELAKRAVKIANESRSDSAEN